MKISHVTPATLSFLSATIGRMPAANYHLILAEYASPDYQKFFRGRSINGDWVIVDNGAYEHTVSGSFHNVLAVADFVLAKEIVMPDDMSSADNTVRLTHEAAAVLHKRGLPAGCESVMVVPHGDDLVEWFGCVTDLLRLTKSWPTSIGIAEKDAIKILNGQRHALAWHLRNYVGPDHPIHLLGMMEDLQDLRDPWTLENIRGVDGSKFVVHGMSEVLIDISDVVGKLIPQYPGRPENFFDIEWGDLYSWQQSSVLSNMAAWQEVYAPSGPEEEEEGC